MTFFYTVYFCFTFSFCLRPVFAYIYISIYYFFVCRESLISKCRPTVILSFFFLCCSQRIYNNNLKRHMIIHTLTRSPPLFFALHSEIVSVILILLDCVRAKANRSRASTRSTNRFSSKSRYNNSFLRFEHFLCILSLRRKFRFLRILPL